VPDAIDRTQMRGKIQRMTDRCKQRRDGAYKVGYSDACKDAMQKLYECSSLETCTVTRCRECRHANERHTTQPFCTIHNRRRAPDDYCNFGETDYE
jgi:hypothetical protein